MPKARRPRTNTHDQSVRLDKRLFALPGRTEYVDAGAAEDTSANDLLISIEPSEKVSLTKKEKQHLKHEAFVQRLESSHSPYSKSHERRMKRKAREQIASGLQDVALALPEIEQDTIGQDEKDDDTDTKKESTGHQKPRQTRRSGLIGEGKGVPLSEKQRRQVLRTEKMRQPLLLATPEFASNPFKALRIHAQNTLIRHEKS